LALQLLALDSEPGPLHQATRNRPESCEAPPWKVNFAETETLRPRPIVEAYSASAKPKIHRELHQPWLIRFASEVTVARRAHFQWHVIGNATESNSRWKRGQIQFVFV